MLKRRYQLLLLAAVVLAAYYPAVLADFSRIDDAGMAASYREMQGWNLGALFIPFSGTNLYYRPLLGLSFLLDKHLLGLLPGLMHLENVLIHLVNAVLVYFLTLSFMPSDEKNRSSLALLAALLFGLHPVNTESVNWISGRTDVLAATFILASALCIMKYRELHENKFAVLSIIACLGGALVKETALAFLPGALLLVTAAPRHENHEIRHIEPRPVRRKFDNGILLLSGIALVVLFFYVPRFTSVASRTSRIGLTLTAITDDWMHSMFITLRAFGYYMKKLVFPIPLNFAIMEVDPLYEVLAVLLLALCLYIATRRTPVSALFTTGALLLAPSFLLAFGQIAWTPYAERYVYISSAFFIVSAVVYLHDAAAIPRFFPVRTAIATILAIMLVSTLSRSVIWQNDLKLCKDTVEKSPMARDIRIVYSTLLTGRGDYTEALVQLEQGRKTASLEYDERIDLNTANVYYKQGRYDEAIVMSETALRRTNGSSQRALDYLIDLMEVKKEACTKPIEKRVYDKRIFEYYLKLFKLKHDPHYLYALGVTAEDLGDLERARRLFRQAYYNLPADDPYKKLAKKKIDTPKIAKSPGYADNY